MTIFFFYFFFGQYYCHYTVFLRTVYNAVGSKRFHTLVENVVKIIGTLNTYVRLCACVLIFAYPIAIPTIRYPGEIKSSFLNVKFRMITLTDAASKRRQKER